MIDTVVMKLLFFKVLSSENFYHKLGKKVPFIDTLKDHSCYWNLPTDGQYQEYRLKSYLKYQPFGYRPWRLTIKDIPQNRARFWLELELALPKVVYGHNLYEIREDQFTETVNGIHDMLLQFGIETSIEEIRTTTNISRVDFCKNILIQTPITDFVQLLQKLQKKRAVTDSTYATTVSFRNKQQRLVVYGKVEEILARKLGKKSYNNKKSKEYQVAQILHAHRELHKLYVIRVEHRLLNRQTIKRELRPIIGSYPFTFEDIFKTEVSSKVLTKHWLNVITEEKFKLLLLGEKYLHLIFDEITKIAKEKSNKNFNAILVLYPKLLSEIGEEDANKKIRQIKSSESHAKYLKELRKLVKELFCYDTRLEDYKLITNALLTFEPFSLPIIPNE